MYESATSVTLANNSRNQGKVGELAWDSGQPHKRLIDCGLSAARRLRGQLRRPVGVSAAEWPGCLGNVQLTLRTVNMLMRSQHSHAHMQDKLREWKGSYKHASYSVGNVKTHMRIHTSTLGHNECISAQGQLETHRQNTASQSIIRTRACALNHLRLAGVPHHCGTGSPGKNSPHTQASARPSPGVGGVLKICKDSILSHRGTLLISFYYCRRHKVRD